MLAAKGCSEVGRKCLLYRMVDLSCKFLIIPEKLRSRFGFILLQLLDY